MELKKIFGKKLLLTNPNEIIIFQKEHTFYINKLKLDFKFNDLVPIENYIETIPEKIFQQIKLELNLSKSLFGYKSSDNLNLYVIDILNCIFIFSIGETQPSLYKIFLEGYFLKQEVS